MLDENSNLWERLKNIRNVLEAGKFKVKVEANLVSVLVCPVDLPGNA